MIFFYNLASFHDLMLKQNDRVISGKWKAPIHHFANHPLHRLVLEFLNSSAEANAILTFTQDYGPLHHTAIVRPCPSSYPDDPDEMKRLTKKYGPVWNAPRPLSGFSFYLSEWRRDQRLFKTIWRKLASGRPNNKLIQSQLAIQIVPNGERSPVSRERFVWVGGQLTFQAENLWRFLLLSLLALPARRIRKCCCPTCPRPYFVPKHSKQKYCTLNGECSKWGSRKAKLAWWNSTGKFNRKKEGKGHA